MLVETRSTNRGRRGAIKTGMGRATGQIILKEKADPEYDPAEYPRLLSPVVEGHSDVIYGSQFWGTASGGLCIIGIISEIDC